MKLKFLFLTFFILSSHCSSYVQAVNDARYPGEEWNQIRKTIKKNIKSFDNKLDDTLVPGLKLNDINFDWQNSDEYKIIEQMDKCFVAGDTFANQKFICNPFYKKAVQYNKIISNKTKKGFYNKNW